MTMEVLPNEILTHILQYLSPIDRLRSEQVCKKWRNASRHTWRDVQALYIIEPHNSNYYYRFNNCTKPHELIEKEDNRLFIGTNSPEIIRCLVSRVRYSIKKLIFDHCRNSDNRVILSDISSYCHNLEIFEIGLIKVFDDEKLLRRLFLRNKELHSFKCFNPIFIKALPLRNWRSLRFVAFATSHETKIISLIRHSKALENFEIRKFTPRIVEVLLKSPKLKSLYFISNSQVPLEMIFDVLFLNRLTNLSIGDPVSKLHMLHNMLKQCCQLKSLRITDYCSGVSMNLMETILAHPVLDTLGVRSSSFKENMLIHLIKIKNLLIDRIAAQITNNGILQMIKMSEILEKLDIKNTDVTPEMFKKLVGEINDRPKYLEVMVDHCIFNEVSEICAGSKIRVVKEIQCFTN